MLLLEQNVVEDDNYRKWDEPCVKKMAEVLSRVAAKVGCELVSSLLSTLYFASFDMKVMKAFIQGAFGRRRTVKAHEAETIVENRFVNADNRCKGSRPGRTSGELQKMRDGCRLKKVGAASGSFVMFVLEECE